MFDRRVKIFLGVLILVIGVLIMRSLQIQVIQHNQWNDWAIKNVLSTHELIDTTRGRLLDRNGLVIADNQACIDACVDFRAIDDEPDKDWVNQIAMDRLRSRGVLTPGMDKSQRAKLIKDEIAAVREDIVMMWKTLANLGNMTDEQMHDLRQSIVDDVKMKQRSVWFRSYELDVEKWQKQKSDSSQTPWYQKLMSDDSDQKPELDKYKIDVREQLQPHPILKAISNDENNFLSKNLDRLPGLVLRPGIHRWYPYGDAAAHIIGHLSQVSAADLTHNSSDEDDLKRYWRTDLIGRTGLEALCEPLLRGSRGRQSYLGDKDHIVEDKPPQPGMDVKTTIDIELQRDIERAFTHVAYPYGKATDPDNLKGFDSLDMPGAAVVIDVATGDVLAMVSHPSYDLNTLDEIYPALAADEIQRPLTNRATQFALEPGSSVKPMVGLGAITQGVLGLNETIECTGYLIIDGHKFSFGRCWTMSMYGHGHHDIPTDDAHPTGFLTYDEALERSCNVFFETVADRLGMNGLRYWYSQFGLGRPTGIGIPEVKGRIPGDQQVAAAVKRAMTWFSGIGQSQVLATPIQMANVASTIARDGIWIRPHLVPIGTEVARKADGPDEVNLHLLPAAVEKAKLGMYKVVNMVGGTGRALQNYSEAFKVAGKTGTAQAASLKIRVRSTDEYGKPIMETKPFPEMDAAGKIVIVQKQVPIDTEVPIPLGTHEHPSPQALWYRGIGDNQDKIAHSWYIGFAPYDKPKIAFAVMVEYGGSGGITAGYVARQALDACVKRGYLPSSGNRTAQSN